MGILGNSLPEELRKELAETSVKVGAVLRFHVDDTNPPKIKRLIVVGVDIDCILIATIFINSEINPYKLSSKELGDLQLKLESNSCDFLEHDSFADCSNLRERDRTSVVEMITSNPDCHLGQLSDEILAEVKKLMKSAKSISVRLKKKYRLFF